MRKFASLDYQTAVESLWSELVKQTIRCVKNVYNSAFIRSLKFEIRSYAHFVHRVYTQLMNSIFALSTPTEKVYAHNPQSLLKLYIYIKKENI